ncbi:ABC transporter ATP-binding protein [Paenibacillus spongiae]|uniref:ABC transporter ATP-binding protein/permease n=1 Tax=Paenibacillus spongiae TaxID=2909671 RepID=A0ABY5S431_9BACL|nr:ABC transporter ATP-binding protein [Paenibacillus spongiae]UVI28238.1 ABC transporter ATP-binding protein/permease [Paenibacillus spongiae]
MWKLRSYLKPYRWAAILAPLLMVMEVCMDLLQPKLMAGIVNEGIMNNNLGYIWDSGLTMILVALIGLIGGVGCTYFSSIASQRFGADLRNGLYQKVQTFSFDNLDKLTTGSLVTRLTGDVVQMQNLVQMLLRMMVRDPSLAIGSIVMAIIISPRLALVLIAVIPILILIIVLVSRMVIPLFNRMQGKLDGLNTVMRENLSGIRVVKAFVRAAFERERFGRANRDYLDIALKASRTVAISMPLMMLVLNASIVVVLWYGGAQTWESALPIGNLIAFLSYLTQLLFSLLSVGMMLIQFSRAKASADRINEVLETVPGMSQPSEGGTAAITSGKIEFDRVSFGYGLESCGTSLDNEHVPVLKEISFTIHPGQTVGILGATGSGKSSMVGLIPRLYDPTEGRVSIDGTDVKEIDAVHLRREVGMVLQQAILFSGTIRDNIRFGQPDAAEAEVVSAAKAAAAHDFIVKLPDGYDTELGQRGVNLSGGQKQRISIARALLLRPRILILDDSTSAVDPATEARIQQSLKELMAESTCVIIAQRISSVTDADNIIVLEDGVIAAAGTHEELIRTSPVYQDIHRSQQRKEVAKHG